jgi:hypothetical protein
MFMFSSSVAPWMIWLWCFHMLVVNRQSAEMTKEAQYSVSLVLEQLSHMHWWFSPSFCWFFRGRIGTMIVGDIVHSMSVWVWYHAHVENQRWELLTSLWGVEPNPEILVGWWKSYLLVYRVFLGYVPSLLVDWSWTLEWVEMGILVCVQRSLLLPDNLGRWKGWRSIDCSVYLCLLN